MLASGCIRRIFLLFVILLLFLFLSSSCTCQQWCSNLTSRKTFCQNVRHFLYRFSHALSIAFLSLFLILSSFPFSLRRFTALWSLHSPSNFASQTSQFFSFSLFPLFFFLLLFNFSFSFISLSHLSRSAVLLVKHGQLSDIPGGSRAGLKTSRRRRNITRKPLWST